MRLSSRGSHHEACEGGSNHEACEGGSDGSLTSDESSLAPGFVTHLSKHVSVSLPIAACMVKSEALADCRDSTQGVAPRVHRGYMWRLDTETRYAKWEQKGKRPAAT